MLVFEVDRGVLFVMELRANCTAGTCFSSTRFNAEGTNSKNNTTGGHVRRTMSIARNENLFTRTVLDSGPRVRTTVGLAPPVMSLEPHRPLGPV